MGKAIDITNVQRNLIAKHKDHSCGCKQVTIDQDTRTVICNNCQAVVDPFDFLLSSAISDNIAFNNYLRLLEEVKRLENKKVKIQREINKALNLPSSTPQ